MLASVLVIDDEKSIRLTLKEILEEEGYLVETAQDIKEAKEKISKAYFHTLILDLWLPDGLGFELIEYTKKNLPDANIIVITGHGKIEDAVKAIREGAYDFIEKPFSTERLLLSLRRAVEDVLKKRQMFQEMDQLIGESPQMLQVKELIRKVSQSDASVLILGESGTGKELVARLIHKLSNRKDGPFVDINCASLPDELLEAELFGYEKGAFTSATSRKQGKLELSHGGTLFLDEIGDMSLKAQAKLLRVLETKSFTRLGGTQVIHSDFRLVSASNKDIKKQMQEGSFREDLYYRIAVFTITLPPLRERGKDIILLAEHFLNYFSTKYARPTPYLTENAKEILLSYPWKGNVRELKNLMERIVILHPGDKIDERFLSGLLNPLNRPNLESLLSYNDLKKARQEFEKMFIEAKLKEYNYDVKKVSEVIGIDLSNLYRKIRNYNIPIKSA
ncbi:sigma-54-dependent transcriptional regulator [Thermocrinis minervae]|uniref:Two-component system, NtrC family, response regulator n=1 Tax=Thermocrinis minervae TaxID=381751 RepID=A0A1M6TI35_9AQUI|nr:sigma-54 dependent transcriptional regulator [Thermocrinis minervae]SHK56655.1 two-component system, NtrC family, response regulator [Thermocrinis minervae]